MNIKREDFDILYASDKSGSGEGDNNGTKSWPPKNGTGDKSEPQSEPKTPSRGPGAMLTEEESNKLIEEAGLTQGKKIDDELLVDEAERAIEDVHSSRKTKGHGSGGILRKRLTDLAKPKVDWKAVLKRYIGNLQSQFEEYFGNRKFIGQEQYLYADRPKYDAINSCAIAIDVSGSVAGDKEFREFVTEASQIAYAKKIKNMHILPFAEKVKDDFIIKDKKPELKDFDRVHRGGGTEAIPHIIAYINAMKSKPSFVVIITDGYLTSGLPQPPKGWGERCIWLIFENQTFEKDYDFTKRWGRVIHCNFDKK